MTNPKPQKQAPKWMVYAFLVIIIAVVFKMCSGCFGGSAKKSQDLGSSAITMSRHYVKAQLQFPEEADFSVMDMQSTILDTAQQIYRVDGILTAKNAIGIKSKMKYVCFMCYKGGDALMDSAWQVNNVKVFE